MREAIAGRFPEDGIFGEEMGSVRTDARFVWVLDPIDGTTLTALGRGNALSVIAVSDRGTMFNPGPCVYMEKIAVGPDAVGAIDITASPDFGRLGFVPIPTILCVEDEADVSALVSRALTRAVP